MTPEWLEETWHRLSEMCAKQKVPHAILLIGPKGAGKTILAKALERLLLCKSQYTTEPCGTCRSCQLYVLQNHPDFRRLGGEEKSISIDDIREVSQFIRQTAHQGGMKIITILGADKLSLPVANALLKTVEEPTDNTVLILTAENAQALTLTLKSRCMQVILPLPPVQKLERNNVFIRVFLDEGKEDYYSEDFQTFINQSPREALYLFYYCCSELIRIALSDPAGRLYEEEEMKRVRYLAKRLPLQQLFFFTEAVVDAIRTLSLPGINRQWLFGSLFAKWRMLCEG